MNTNEIILQLANIASGIERTQGDSIKAKALREAIKIIDDTPKTDQEKRYNLHGCGSANQRIKKLAKECSEMAAQLKEVDCQLSVLLNVRGIENFDEVNNTKVINALSKIKDGLNELHW